jgi:hypothetical protein
MSGD